MKLYEFEEKHLKQFLRRHKAKRAAIQLPTGLRKYLPEIRRTFDKAGVNVLVLADSCFGACDLADEEAKRLGSDVLVHYGHADMGLPTCLPTFYFEARMSIDPLETLKSALPKLNFKRVGLITTVQHIAYLSSVGEFLRSRGIEPVVGERGPRTKYPGQVLGCDVSCARSIADRVEGFLYIGTGEFHPLGVALVTGKRVIVVNPVVGSFKEVSPNADEFLKRRKAMISRSMACQRFGIVVSTKRGQARFKLAGELLENFKRTELTAHLLVVDEVQPEKLADFGLEAFVCVACPRIPVDDAERFEYPVLTPFEAKVVLGKAKFDPYRMDEVNYHPLKRVASGVEL